jgi:hypothetical protein
MGPYCMFCDHRCFVEDVAGRLLATCQRGIAHDRAQLGYAYGDPAIFEGVAISRDASKTYRVTASLRSAARDLIAEQAATEAGCPVGAVRVTFIRRAKVETGAAL